MRTITVEVRLLSPEGTPLEVTISGRESDSALLADLAENAEEYLDWVKSERLGVISNGWVN
jgi:hypothetical protein